MRKCVITDSRKLGEFLEVRTGFSSIVTSFTDAGLLLIDVLTMECRKGGSISFHVAICIFLSVSLCSGAYGQARFDAKKNRPLSIKELLPKNYDRTAVPREESTGRPSDKIYVGMYVMDLYDVDERNMEITMQIYLKVHWEEPRLRLEDDLGENSTLFFDGGGATTLYVPDVYFRNTRRISLPQLSDFTEASSVRIYGRKMLRYTRLISLTVGCPMNFLYFPMDSQECPLTVEVFANKGHYVGLEWASTHDEEFQVSPELFTSQFQVNFYPMPAKNVTVDGATTPLLEVKVKLKRKLSYQLMQTYIPSALLVIMSWFSYLVPIEPTPARMLLCVATILSTMTMYTGIQERLPQVSYVKAIDVWMLACLFFVSSSMVEFLMAIFLHQRQIEIKAKANSRRSVMDRLNGKSLVARGSKQNLAEVAGPAMDQNTNDEIQQQQETSSDADKKERDGTCGWLTYMFSHPKALDRFSFKVYMILFVTFNAIYWLVNIIMQP